MTDEEYLRWLEDECHYQQPRVLPDGRWAAVMPLFATHAVIVGQLGDENGYDDRWCYGSALAAHAALAVWDGTGEPAGWHRHPKSGRRIARDEQEYDDNGNLIPIGQEYVRR